MKPKVYFSREITPEKVVELYERLGKSLPGKVAVKLHSGEKGNQNYLGPDMWKPMIEMVGGTVVECNTAYEGARNTTERHIALMEEHGWSKNFTVDILDAEGPDMVLDIPEGRKIKKNYVGKDMANYDSMLILSHFKGHPMGGYGGALKQLSIGCASSYGKAYIHGVGDASKRWTADQIATEAQFFSFGTNDLTQMTFGFSRDDAGKFLGAYYDKKIYESDPFARLDQTGVGKLVDMAAKLGRATRPELHLGICGEHGGDPSSVEFCHKVGLDYVSCSPFRVPIARLAAAQAAIKNG